MHPLIVIIVIANINVPIALYFVYFKKIESNLACFQPTIEIQLKNSAPTVESPSSKSTNTNAAKINIGTYRELIVVTGVVICCILLFIMVRDIRIHYCTISLKL